MRPVWTTLALARLGVTTAVVLSQAAVAEQLELGKGIYAARCAECHGMHGEGDKAPALIGPNHNLSGYRTAEGLFDYTRKVMPGDRPGRLIEAQYWAVLAYILSENHLLPEPTTRLGRDNAAQIPLDQ